MKGGRRAPRIATSLEGTYWKLTSSDNFGKIEKATIVNLSLGGCCLVADQHSLALYDRITVVFRLDDAYSTKIQREATLCRVAGSYIGCKFATKVSGYEPDLSLYLNDRLQPK